MLATITPSVQSACKRWGRTLLSRDALLSLSRRLPMQVIGTRLLIVTAMACTAGTWAARGQDGPAAASAYYIADFELTDAEAIKPYSAKVESTFKPFGGRFIVRGGDPVPLEGRSPKGRLVVIEFDSIEKAQAWYNSAAYAELRPIRQKAGHSNIYIVQGLVRN
jgi:uncharacterized protein (DUF1330 family)